MSEEMILKDSGVLSEKDYERRTRNMAFERYPDLFHIPEGVMYMISHQNYSGSLDWKENEYGYLRLLRDDVSVSFDDGVMYANGIVSAKLSFKDVYTNENLTDIDKPLLDALFSVVLMKLRNELDKVCPPGYSNDIQFRVRQPKDVREASDETLFDWYHKDLFNYTVTVYLPDLMRYLGYENISDKGNVRFVLKNNPKYIEGTKRPKYLLAITSTKTALHDLQVENEDEDDEVEYVVCVSDVKRIMKEEVYDVESGVCYADAALAHGMYSLEPYSFYATRVEE